MPRDVDERKKRRALRKLRRAADLAEQGLGPPLSDWEVTFLEELEERIETYGSAFADPTKGNLEEPLSALQQRKLKEIDKKARGKSKGSKAQPRKGLPQKTMKPVRSLKQTPGKSGDIAGPDASETPRPTLSSVPDVDGGKPDDRGPGRGKTERRPTFRVIVGGRKD
ncbi:MAG: hypothetical protein AAFY85_01095 [Pseudomonadota bacterium]